jgi:hypothetical protein
MGVVREQFNFSNAAVVFLQVTDQLTAADFPDTDIALHATTAEELAVASKFNCCNAVLVCIVYLPKQLAVVNSESAYFTI